MSTHRALVFTINVLFVLAMRFHVTEANFFPCPCPAPAPNPTTTLVVYLQDIIAQNGTIPTNATSVPVAGIQGTAYNLQQFGTYFVVDDNITASASPNSTLLGQALGTLVVTSPKGGYYQVTLTLVFNNTNSTLVLLGVVIGQQPVRSVAVVGGTGIYTFATGNATFETVTNQGPYTVEKLTVTFK